MGDQARALIGAGRAAKWIGGCGNHHRPTVRHSLELAPQQHGLLARLPGMRHRLCRGRVIAGQRIPADVDPRRQHQPVITEHRVAAERHKAALRVHPPCLIMDYRNTFGAEGIIAETLLPDRPQSGDYGVAEGASREDRTCLDEGHGSPRHGALQFPRAGGAGKAAADNDNTRPALRHERSCQQRGRGGRGAAAQKRAPRRPHHRFSSCAASQSAMARISTSEKPLAIRPMTVEGRSSERKASIAATISSGSRPRIRGTGVFTVALAGWQPEQELAPGGASAAAALTAPPNEASSTKPRIACRSTARARQVEFRPWFINGSERMRLPVAAKIALSTAGAATAIVGSPTPPQKSPVGRMTVSTCGISSMRITL